MKILVPYRRDIKWAPLLLVTRKFILHWWLCFNILFENKSTGSYVLCALATFCLEYPFGNFKRAWVSELLLVLLLFYPRKYNVFLFLLWSIWTSGINFEKLCAGEKELRCQVVYKIGFILTYFTSFWLFHFFEVFSPLSQLIWFASGLFIYLQKDFTSVFMKAVADKKKKIIPVIFRLIFLFGVLFSLKGERIPHKLIYLWPSFFYLGRGSWTLLNKRASLVVTVMILVSMMIFYQTICLSNSYGLFVIYSLGALGICFFESYVMGSPLKKFESI